MNTNIFQSTGKVLLGLLAISLFSNPALSQDQHKSDFKKTVISKDFISEGVAVADLNKDGLMDIVAGYFWFEAPNWTQHEISPSRAFDPRKEYSNSFLNLGMDVNLDGWDDVVIIDYPGTPAYWFENPKTASNDWQKHIIADSVGISNESPAFVDMDGDGRVDILCGDYKTRQIIWLKAPTQPGETEWKRFALTEENVPGTDRFSHGLGYGDINGDKIKDVVISEGWFEGKADLTSGDWVFHPATISDKAAHMQILDVNGDMKNDVVSSSAHSMGVWWQEYINDSTFQTHLINNLTSQTHATILADLNGDGEMEMIAGKRYLAHNGNDAGDADTPYLFYIEFTPMIGPFFREHIIDNDSGAGLNITVEDMNKDGKPDIVIANKNGIFLFENQIKK
ncbi:FG-GAP repeat domain-containing protein [Algoriphagus aquimarinus]|uniref:Repeat domain-containing protein n=1 Tax=Algoriphagus aquimarinus TaxID=237018 RepID=A0A1I1BPN1_9BACT|nr:VCBS repeat-containing protein [Algoriphagus aquimarinus]SFB52414.1 Repeat domain-containing protein [Algoriphagus aquimarinus]